MSLFLADIRNKEVINMSTGIRLGYVSDVEVDVSTGQIISIVVPGPSRYLGLLGREEDFVIPWKKIGRIGEDIILVDIPQERGRRHLRDY